MRLFLIACLPTVTATATASFGEVTADCIIR